MSSFGSFKWLNNRNVIIMCCVTFLVVLAEMMYTGSLQSQFLFLLRHSLHDIGISSLVAGICEAVLVFPASWLADRFRRDWIIRASGVFGLATLALHGCGILFRCLPVLYVSIAMQSIGVCLYNPAAQALFSDSLADGQRSKAFSFVWCLSNSAYALGYFLTIPLFKAFENAWTLSALTAVMLIGVSLAIGLTPFLSFSCCLHVLSPMMFLAAFVDNRRHLASSDAASSSDNVSLQEIPVPAPPEAVPPTPTVSPEPEVPVDEQEQHSTVNHEPVDEITSEETIQDHQDRAEEAPSPPFSGAFAFTPAQPRRHRRAIPYMILSGDVLQSIAGGIIIQYLSIFANQVLRMSPIEVSLLYGTGAVLAAVLSLASHQIAKWAGRVPTVLSLSLAGTLSLIGLSFTTNKVVGGLLFVLRFGCFNATDALAKSLLMDYTPEKQRARWSAIDSVASVTWSGSAELGAWLLARFSWRPTFWITGAILLVAHCPWLVLTGMIDRKENLTGGEARNEKSVAVPPSV